MAHHQETAQVKFAIEITTLLQKHASKIATDDGVKKAFPSQLASQALHVKDNLQQLLDAPDGFPQKTGRLLSKYLENIERLYQVIYLRPLLYLYLAGPDSC